MKDIFNRHNYIIEADDDDGEDTDFTSSSLNTDDNGENDGEEPNETDEQSNNDSNQSSTDFTALDDDNNSDDNNEDDTQDENTDGEDSEENNADEEMGDEENYEEDEDSYVDLVAKEKELYSSLSAFDIQTRNEEIKVSFSKLYDFINEYLNILADVKKSNVNLKVLEYCEEKLLELKEMTYYYIVNNFSHDSYIQRQIRYKKILFTISKIIDLLDKISDKKETKEDV